MDGNKLRKLAEKHPQLRTKVLPFLKRNALERPNVWVTVDKTGVFFEFDYPIPSMGLVNSIQNDHVIALVQLLDKTVEILRRTFREGKGKVPSKMHYTVQDRRIVLMGPAPTASGVFGLDVPALISEAGGSEGFERVVTSVIQRAGWTVRSIDGVAGVVAG